MAWGALLGRVSRRPGHAEFAARPAEELGEAEFAETVRVLGRLSAGVEAVGAAGMSSPSEA
ncbi:hypothetical protein ACFU8Q_15845 [Streptomyces sp. NPDC057543]|uniref:hypothetical protein n=1 Tax=Streptomyces sp. NPDC057543 TaxID=3346163 RepID=UPI0036A74D98